MVSPLGSPRVPGTERGAPRLALLAAAVLSVAVLGVAVLVVTPLPSVAAGVDATLAVAGATVPPPSSQALGGVPANDTTSFTVALAPTPGVSTTVAGLYDPHSPTYHQWLDPARAATTFGPRAGSVSAATRWLTRGGFSVRRDGDTLVASGPAGDEHLVLGVHPERYRSGGVDGVVATGTPRVPTQLAGAVTSIGSLSTFDPVAPHVARVDQPLAGSGAGPHVTPSITTACSAIANTGYWPLDALGASYGIAGLQSAGMTGSGTSIGIIGYATYSTSDLAAFDSCMGRSNPITHVLVDGGGGTTITNGELEADLDVEQVEAQAPGASIIYYDGDSQATNGFYDAFAAAVHADVAKVLSVSWGECELYSASVAPSLDLLLEQAAAQGQSVFVASGDSGSEDCYAESRSTALEVDYPAASPWVTAVGGTDRSFTGAESVWNSCGAATSSTCAQSGGGAGGGGLSRTEAIPSWQSPVDQWSTAQSCGVRCREVPDVSANAGIGEEVYYGGGWVVVGGTSAAAPLWAGMIGDEVQGCATSYGDLDPVLYGLSAASGGLADVTQGNNDLTDSSNHADYTATAGYDVASGLGVPSATALSCTQITGTSVSSGAVGSQIVLSGIGLAGASVFFGSTPAVEVSSTATSAVVTVPAGTGTVSVHGSDALGSGAGGVSFTYQQSAAQQEPADPGAPSGLPAVTGGTGSGYRMVASDGGIFTFGTDNFFGSTGALHLNAPIVGMASTPDGRGYWLVASDGGIFAFGDAGFYGSTGAIHLNRPIVGMASTPDGRGYWLVAADGGIFAFGDATFYGSTGAIHLNRPIVAMAPTPSGHGYWLVASDGGIFAFGDADFSGSTGAMHLNAPIVAMAPTPSGHGYWLVASDGGIFAFGDAGFYGSTGGTHLNRPIVGMAA